MARYMDHNAMTNDPNMDWERVAAFYGYIIGLLITKTGPVVISQEDMALYSMARLKPFIEQNEDIDGIRAYLLGEDEWPEHNTDTVTSVG